MVTAAGVVLALMTSLAWFAEGDAEDGTVLLLLFLAVAAATAGVTLVRSRALRIACGVALAALCLLNAVLAWSVANDIDDGGPSVLLALVATVVGGVWLLVHLVRDLRQPAPERVDRASR
jgi:hypothetical protein